MNLSYFMFANKMSTNVVDLASGSRVVAKVKRKINLTSVAGANNLAFDGYSYTATLVGGKVKLGPCNSMTDMLERIRQALSVQS